ncbi:MAG: hypothetical protein GX221_09580 [Candidatus Riflebacteria bacterium]|nr:hypothetical protein [Candidatus Riflebacteria bacterium]
MKNSPFLNSFSKSPLVIAKLDKSSKTDPLLAKTLIKKAAESGADMVSFPLFHISELAFFPDSHPADNDFEYAKELSDCAIQSGITLLPVIAGKFSLEYAQKLGCKAIKLASGEMTNIPLLEQTAASGLAVFLSTGASTAGEIETALEALRSFKGNEADITLLQCTASPVTRFHDANLNAMKSLSEAFLLPIGFSDNCPGHLASLGAATLGAKVIEKAISADNPPPRASILDIDSLASFIQNVRLSALLRGSDQKIPTAFELKNQKAIRRGLKTTRKISAGETITEDSIAAFVGSKGISPELQPQILNRRVTENLEPGTPLTWDHLGELVSNNTKNS